MISFFVELCVFSVVLRVISFGCYTDLHEEDTKVHEEFDSTSMREYFLPVNPKELNVNRDIRQQMIGGNFGGNCSGFRVPDSGLNTNH